MLLSSPKFTTFTQIHDKNNWDSLYFYKKVHKKTFDLLKITQNSPSPWLNDVRSLKKPCDAVKTRNELPICNQRWIREEGRRISHFLLLIADILSEDVKILRSSNYLTIQYFLLKICIRFLHTRFSRFY